MSTRQRKRLKLIGCTVLTIAAIMFSLLWIAVVFVTIRSYWRTDSVFFRSYDHIYELSSHCGRFYTRIWSSRRDNHPSRFDFDCGWSTYKSTPKISDGMERRIKKYGFDQKQFLGFRWARGDPSQSSGDVLWIRFVHGPIWPFLPVLAIPPVGLLWWRRRFPREQRRTALRITLILYSLPIGVALILLIMAAVNTHFLGPREKPLYGQTSHPAVRPASDPNGIVLKVMTYNIAFCWAYKGGWRFEKPERVAEHVRRIGELIKEQKPDLVFLQEVVMESGPDSVNQTPILAESAGMHAWAFGEDVNQGLPFYRFISGNVILSRWPLEVVTNQSMAVRRKFFQVGMWTPRTLWCKIQVGNQEVLLASVHLITNWWYKLQQTQMQQVLHFAGGRPAILAGDFNIRPDDSVIRQAVDSGTLFAKLDGPPTVSSYNPTTKIDYIFAPTNWKLIDHKVIQTELSDHMPVLSTYRIPLVEETNLSGRGR